VRIAEEYDFRNPTLNDELGTLVTGVQSDVYPTALEGLAILVTDRVDLGVANVGILRIQPGVRSASPRQLIVSDPYREAIVAYTHDARRGWIDDARADLQPFAGKGQGSSGLER